MILQDYDELNTFENEHPSTRRLEAARLRAVRRAQGHAARRLPTPLCCHGGWRPRHAGGPQPSASMFVELNSRALRTGAVVLAPRVAS